jgi:photosystem II stability/assembly factor-like uncharacterized protein
MKTICLNRIQCLVAVPLMLVGVLLTCYSAIGNLGHGGMQDIENIADVVPTDEDGNAEYLEKRHEFLDRFFGTGLESVSAADYTRALAAARALPPSPLLQGRSFVSPETLEAVSPWSLSIAPPIHNSYGGNASVRVHSLAIDPINANVVYAGSFGGLAKTTDGGVTWRYLSDAWTSQSVSSIAVSPNASNVVYVGTGRDGGGYDSYEAGVYRSFDGGTTWHRLGAYFAGTYVRTIAIDPNTRESMATMYVANSGTDTCGLWQSTNSGRTWTRLRQGPAPVDHGTYDVAIDSSTHPSTLYITDDDGVFKSVDSGQSWMQVLSIPACEAGQGCRPSRLSGLHSALYLLAGVGEHRKLYKSANAGTKWTQIPSRCPCQTLPCYGIGDTCASNDNIGFGVFAVDPFNPNVILGGNQALYRTDNEGMTWTEIEPWDGRNIHTDQRVITFSQIAPGVAYDGNDGGVVRSTNDGLAWANLNQNLPGALLYSVALSADGSMIAGTQDNGAIYSSLGTPWRSFKDGDSAHDLIDPIGSTWAYKVSYGPSSFMRFNREAYPYQSINISPSTLIHEPCAFFPTFSMSLSNPKHLLAACQHVVRTLDGPTVTQSGWTPIGNCPSASPTGSPCPSGVVVTATSEAPSNADVIYAVTNSATVFVTQNAGQGNGATWQQVTHWPQSRGINAVTVDPNNYQTAYLACNLGVYKTTDMGMTWTQQGVSNLMYNDLAIDPANAQHIFTASNAGVFASTDGGNNWGNMSDGIPAGMKVTALSFNAINRQLAVSTYGRGVYTLNLGAQPAVFISSSANLTTTSGL